MVNLTLQPLLPARQFCGPGSGPVEIGVRLGFVTSECNSIVQFPPKIAVELTPPDSDCSNSESAAPQRRPPRRAGDLDFESVMALV
jgi:hypothetical protein